MKTKKIISVLAALSMVATMFTAVTAGAAATPSAPKFTLTATANGLTAGATVDVKVQYSNATQSDKESIQMLQGNIAVDNDYLTFTSSNKTDAICSASFNKSNSLTAFIFNASDVSDFIATKDKTITNITYTLAKDVDKELTFTLSNCKVAIQPEDADATAIEYWQTGKEDYVVSTQTSSIYPTITADDITVTGTPQYGGTATLSVDSAKLGTRTATYAVKKGNAAIDGSTITFNAAGTVTVTLSIDEVEIADKDITVADRDMGYTVTPPTTTPTAGSDVVVDIVSPAEVPATHAISKVAISYYVSENGAPISSLVLDASDIANDTATFASPENARFYSVNLFDAEGCLVATRAKGSLSAKSAN